MRPFSYMHSTLSIDLIDIITSKNICSNVMLQECSLVAMLLTTRSHILYLQTFSSRHNNNKCKTTNCMEEKVKELTLVQTPTTIYSGRVTNNNNNNLHLKYLLQGVTRDPCISSKLQIIENMKVGVEVSSLNYKVRTSLAAFWQGKILWVGVIN